MTLMVVGTLCLLALGGLTGVFLLTFTHTPIPDFLGNLVSASIGAVSALLVSIGLSRTGPDPIPPDPIIEPQQERGFGRPTPYPQS